MIRKVLLIVFFSILTTTNAWANESFLKGYEEYKKKNYSEAQSQFLKVLQENPNNLAVLLDLSLSYYQNNQKGLAMGYLLKANKLDPNFEPVNQSLEVVRSQLKANNVPQKESDFELFRKSVLNKISLNSILTLAALTLLFAGYLWIQYFSKRKKANDEELDLPDFPVIGVIISLVFIVFASLGLAKVYEEFTPRAVIITENTEIKMAPGAEQAQLFVLQEGSEVLVGQIQNDWVQVTYPGSYTGWVSKEKIFLVR